MLAGVGVVALGFGGGFGGAVAASRMGLTGSQVVVQQVQRSTDTDATTTGSTGGTSMSVQQIASVVSLQRRGHHHRADEQQPDLVRRLLRAERCRFRRHHQPGWLHPRPAPTLSAAQPVLRSSWTAVMRAMTRPSSARIPPPISRVLKIDATGLTLAVIGDSDALAVGEVAVAVGNPLGTLSNTVTDGVVSALNRQVTVQDNDMTLIQTDASISPGNPLAAACSTATAS